MYLCTQTLPELSLHTVTHTDADIHANPILSLIHTSSNYSKLIRTVAYIKRFINNCKQTNKKSENFLFGQEIKQAEFYVLSLCQQEMFPKEYKTLKLGLTLGKKNKLNSLSPFMDANNLLRVGGRLKHSHYSYDVKHPILLCSKHHITKIIVRMYHINLLHAGPQLLLANLRLNFWILNGRNLKNYRQAVR